MKASTTGRRHTLRRAGRATLGFAFLGGALLGHIRGTQDAVANGDTRTLSILHMHTKESATITFKRSGRYDPQALEQLNWLLRDWRSDEPTKMDPRLFDIVWEAHRAVGSSEPIHVVSAYRSPETNSMLRRRSRGVAKHSQHTQGKALDFYMPDVPVERVRAVAMRMQHGGVGYYPSAHSPFVHLDAGSVRSWPRMTRDQLARLFPDGRTVHLPSDNKPMPGYEEARAEILARGGTVSGYASAYADAGEASGGSGRSFWASLFGSDDEDSDYYAQAAQTRRGRQTARAPAAPQQVAAYAPSSHSNDAGRFPAAFEAARPAPPPAPARPAPEPEPVTAAPEPAREPAPIRVAAAGEPPIAPRMAWQPGPAAQESADARVPLMPLPPRRPDDLPTLATAYAEVPLPPARPLAFASLAPVQASANVELRGAMGDLIARVTAPAPPRAAATAAAPAPEPVKPAQPPERPKAPAPPAASDERSALRALFAAATTETTASAPVRVATARTTLRNGAAAGLVTDAGPGLALGFTTNAAELAPDRFTGPAVKPLPVRR